MHRRFANQECKNRITGNGISKLVFTILSTVAEAERHRIREGVAQVKQDQKDRGRYLGVWRRFLESLGMGALARRGGRRGVRCRARARTIK